MAPALSAAESTSFESPAVGPEIGSLLLWLRQAALPLWAKLGVDWVNGGFFEKISVHGVPAEEPRRARVVARQIYVFATAERKGWFDGAGAIVDHGLQFLFERLHRPDGTFASSVLPDGTIVDSRFDLYEQAFVLFALAAASRVRPQLRPRLAAEAVALLNVIRVGWGHPASGFEEANPRALPLRSNPHMHLLEAALEWSDLSVPGEPNPWSELIEELVSLCRTRFIDPDSGALQELFDGDWSALPAERGQRIEPGHQFEWSWLLMRWAGQTASGSLAEAASLLLHIGESRGVDPHRNVAVDAIDDHVPIFATGARLWPQTERIKAWHAAMSVALTAHDAWNAGRHLRCAIAGLSQFFIADPSGLWHEEMASTGRFASQACRASSLYHIVCAIDALTPCPKAER